MARATESKQPLYTQNILAVDIGTTTISCHHFDRSGISLYHTSRKVGGSPLFSSEFCETSCKLTSELLAIDSTSESKMVP